MSAPVKMVVVVRADLGMSRGKVAAQAIHAAFGALRNVPGWQVTARQDLETWAETGETVVVLQCDSEEDLVLLALSAGVVGLPHHLVVDEGRTEFGGRKTTTCMAVGPALSEKIDEVTGKLKVHR